MEKTGEANYPTKGKMATCYLGKQYRAAMEQAMEDRNLLHSQYVKLAVMERLFKDGVISAAALEVEQAKITFRQKNRETNSKESPRVREVVREREEEASGAYVGRRERVGARNITLAERRAARRIRRERPQEG